MPQSGGRKAILLVIRQHCHNFYRFSTNIIYISLRRIVPRASKSRRSRGHSYTLSGEFGAYRGYGRFATFYILTSIELLFSREIQTP